MVTQHRLEQAEMRNDRKSTMPSTAMTATWTGPEKLPITQPAIARHAEHVHSTATERFWLDPRASDDDGYAEIGMVDSLMIT